MLVKAYFEKGYALTSYFKYLIGFFALASQDIEQTMIIGGVYGLSCFVVGYVWYKSKMIEAEIEVNNQFNLFVKEMRKSIK